MSKNQSNLINEVIKFLAIACKSISVYHIFTDSRMALFIDVILPFFSSTQKEINDLNDDPNEFV